MTLPDRELTDERVAIILDHLHRSPNSECGIKSIWNAFPAPRPALNAVTDWVQVLLQRGLVRITRHADGRPLYGPVDFDTLLEPDDVDDTLRRPILAVLASGPAMAGRIAERLDVPARFIQATTLVMWREGELIGSPVGAGFVMRAAQPMTADEAAAILRTWTADRAEREEPDEDVAEPTPTTGNKAPHLGTPLPRAGSLAARYLAQFSEPCTIDDARAAIGGMHRVAAASLVHKHVAGGNIRPVGQQGRYRVYQLTDPASVDALPYVPTYLGESVPPAPPGQGWTPERLDWFKAAFPKLGVRACAVRLGMSDSPVHRRARVLDLTYGDIPGYIKGAELADLTGRTSGAILEAAKRARVLVFSGTPDSPGLALVPIEWADRRAERSALPDEDDLLLSDITQDRTEVARIRARFRAHLYLRTPPGQRPQVYVPRRLEREIRDVLASPAANRPTYSWEGLLPWLEVAGPEGLTAAELTERSNLSRGAFFKTLQRAIQSGMVERFVWDQHIPHVFRHAQFRDAPRPTFRPGYGVPSDILVNVVTAAGVRGVTLHEARAQLPNLLARNLEGRLERLVREGRATRTDGDWATPYVYLAAGITPGPEAERPPRTDQPEPAVSQAMQDLDEGSGVTAEQIAVHLRQSYYQVTLSILRLQTRRAVSTRKEGRESYYVARYVVPASLNTPPRPPKPRPAPAAAPPRPPARRTPAPAPTPPIQEIPMTPTTPSPAPAIVPTSLVQQLAVLEEQARPLEQLQTDLADLDQRRQVLVTRIADAQSARDVLTRITQSISSVLNPAPADPVSEPVRPAVHVQPTPAVATPVPQAAPEVASDPERRRGLFPAPIPDGLTPEELRVFKLLREIKEGLPFKQIISRLNMPSDQASKAIDGLTASGHLRKSGSHYRAHAQAQAA